MRHLTIWLLGLTLPGTAIAQDCWTAGSGPYGAQIPAWALVIRRPEVKSETVLSAPTALRTALVVARQDYAIKPATRYLAAGIDLRDEKGRSLSQAVPLAAGSPITVWRNSTEERHCSIGWKNGLFGGATGEGHYRWICLEDRDRDGKYDSAWRTKTGNMGLSYSRVDLPLTQPVGWTDEPPAAGDTVKGGGPLSEYPAHRSIEVERLSAKSVRLRYLGVGVDRSDANQVELPLDRPGTAMLGGIEIVLTPTANGSAEISARGSFEAQEVTSNCRGTNHRIGGFETRVMFSFPNW